MPEVALGDFLPNEDAPLADVTAEGLGEAQHRARNAPFHGEKVRGHQRLIGVAQPLREQCRDVTVEFRPGLSKRLEGAAAYEAQL